MKPISLDKIKQDWFLLCKSQTIKKNGIKAFQLFNVPIVVFRQTDNSLGALLDRCPHRNVPLSQGKLVNNCLVCPYHGWQFNKAGLCTTIPGLTDKPKAIRVQTLSIKENNGYIWISLKANNEERLPIIPHLTDPKYDTFVHEFSAQCTFVNLLENFLDPMHTHFIHAGLIRKDALRKNVTVTLKLEENSVEALYQGEDRRNGFIARWLEKSRSKSYGRFILPATGQLEYRGEKSLNMLITAYLLPVDEDHIKITAFFTTRRGILPHWLKRILVWPVLRLALAQDLRILKLQKENIAKFQNHACYQYTKLDLMRPYINKLLTFQEEVIKPFTDKRIIEI